LLGTQHLKKLVTNTTDRITDVCGIHPTLVARSWGDQLLPHSFLKFRCKYGSNVGKTVFQFQFPESLMDTVWNDIKKDIDIALDVIWDEDRFWFLKRLTRNNFAASSGCPKGEPAKTSRFDSLETFDKLIKRSWEKGQFWRRKVNYWISKRTIIRWDDLTFLIVYAQGIDWNNFEIFINTDIKFTTDFEGAVSCFLLPLIMLKLQPGCKKQLSDCSTCIRGFLRTARVDAEWKSLVDAILNSNDSDLLDVIHDSKIIQMFSEQNMTVFSCRTVPVWEVIAGILVRVKCILTDSMLLDVVRGVVETARCCAIHETLKKLKDIAYSEEQLKHFLLHTLILKSIEVGTRFFDTECCSRGNFKFEERMCAMKQILAFYSDVYQSVEWLTKNPSYSLVRWVPVELLKAAEDEHQIQKIRDLINQEFKHFNLEWLVEQDQVTGRRWGYCSKSHWEIFLSTEKEELRKFLDHEDEDIMKSRWVPLLRVWHRRFGKHKARIALENPKYLNGKTDLWQYASSEMIDGELLHVAVELESIIGVRTTAWPGLLNWRNDIGMSAVELAEKSYGTDSEICHFLMERQTVYDTQDSIADASLLSNNLFSSGKCDCIMLVRINVGYF